MPGSPGRDPAVHADPHDLGLHGPDLHDRLVDDLAGRLAPVRPLPAAGLRAALWLGAVLLLGLTLATRMESDGFMGRMQVPDLALSAAGALLTAAAAAFAAFATSVPGRPAAWALLPVAPAILWIGAGGLGCLRGWLAPGTDVPDAREIGGCLAFLVCVSAPLSLLIVLMLRQACPLRPNLTAALGGLAAAAAAAVLLMPFHPHDATATDLMVHAAAVLGVVAVNGLAGGRLLAGGGAAV